jgi:hypothetical protein
VLEVRPELANHTNFGNSYNVMHHAAGQSCRACFLPLVQYVSISAVHL